MFGEGKSYFLQGVLAFESKFTRYYESRAEQAIDADYEGNA
jgi:hypothetical protein